MGNKTKERMKDSSDKPNPYYQVAKRITGTIYLLVLYYLLHNGKQGYRVIIFACPFACISLVMASERNDFHNIQYEC